MARSLSLAIAFVLLIPALLALRCPPPGPVDRDKLELPGLEGRVRVTTDALGVPHVFARSLLDAVRVQGYLHARDRFFQMDVNRRRANGTLAELTGNFADLASDAETRMLGLRAAAQRSLDALEPEELALLEAYVDGVNAWLAANPLPAEYTALETSAVPPWTPLDTLTMGKGLAAAFNVRLQELDETAYVLGYLFALGEEAAALFYPAEMGRFAPWVPYATVPDAMGAPLAAAQGGSGLELAALRDAGQAAQRMRSRASETGFLAQSLEHPDAIAGSNAWGVAARHSATGLPLVAGDGHDALTAPARDYEIHLVVADDPMSGPLNVTGSSSPGVPGVGAGQNTHVAWASTALYTDASDVFRDRLIRDDPSCPAQLCILSAGEMHPVEERNETYLLNLIDGVLDDPVDVTAGVASMAPEAVHVLSVPFRSFGPALQVDDRSILTDGGATETGILTLQWTGLHEDRGARYLLESMRARDLFEFLDAMQWNTLPGASGNFVVADVDGNLAYAAAGEIPLRADLETGTVAGAPPWLIRDGSGPANWVADPARSQGQVLPFAVIPREEMPHVVNPPAGFVVNCNEDPSGFGLDNDLLNQFRPSKPGAIHYLGDWGTRGLRNGRVTRLLQEKIEAGEPISLDDMKRIQANNQPLHADLLVPHLLAAFEAAQAPGAAPELAALAADPRVAEAAGRLAAWDFSTPTGIPEGYDASDEDGVRNPDVSAEEAAHSVAATLYGVWFFETLRAFNQGLTSQGLPPRRAFYTLVWLLGQEPFTTVGVSGVDFIPEPAALGAEDRRDLLLLGELRDALNALAAPAYAAAFARSTNQDDYRWGKLNRVVIEHPLGGASSIPPAAGFQDLAPQLPGLARDGTWDTVNVSSFTGGLPARANDWMSSFGSIWRHVHAPLRASRSGFGMLGFAALAGGASGDPTSPLYASQLAKWLTVDYHRMPMSRRDVRMVAERVEVFTPPRP